MCHLYEYINHCHLLTVKKEKPKFVKRPEDVTVMEQEDARFETTVSGKPAPIAEWFRGETKLEPSDTIVYEQDGNKHGLLIKTAQLDQAGPYSVKITNEVGTFSAMARLKVTGKFLFSTAIFSFSD